MIAMSNNCIISQVKHEPNQLAPFKSFKYILIEVLMPKTTIQKLQIYPLHYPFVEFFKNKIKNQLNRSKIICIYKH